MRQSRNKPEKQGGSSVPPQSPTTSGLKPPAFPQTPPVCNPSGPPGCYNCVHAIYDVSDQIAAFASCWPYRPMCSNHPDSLGQMRKVPVRGPCRNWRPKPTPPVRLDPPPDECKITLTKGLFATVDPADLDWLNGFRWHATCSRGRTYAATVIGGRSISMHRLIMNPPRGMWVDHKNGDRLDNTRENLRIVTPTQNRHNSRSGPRRGKPKSSQFIGVTRSGDRWKVKITHQGQAYFLGYFDDEVEAAKAWDAKAKELRGEFTYLNFPEEEG
ncbi:MAG: HNH endonuclease [Phycisphaerales bacterium]